MLFGTSKADSMPGDNEVAWMGYGDALKSAKSENKKVIVDVYTNWCGWCKRMDKDVYGNGEIREYLKKHYVSVKLNAESSAKHDVAGSSKSETEIARGFGISSYPTTVFLNSQGELITSVAGYIKADMFTIVLEYIGEDHYKSVKWDDFLKSKQKG
jgi:thioredoxin-related protein